MSWREFLMHVVSIIGFLAVAIIVCHHVWIVRAQDIKTLECGNLTGCATTSYTTTTVAVTTFAPFDVAPKETKSTWCADHGAIDCGFDPQDSEITIHRTCEDKSRFLLMSADGRWHCLDLKGWAQERTSK
jgi:hypothetical protein